MMRSSDKPPRLLVEGRNDKRVVEALLVRHGFALPGGQSRGDPNAPKIIADEDGRSGVGAVLQRLTTFLKSTPNLGVIVDADRSAAERWEQLLGLVEREDPTIRLPLEPDADGTIVEGHRPGWRLGFWIMPDNTTAGMLEDFLARLVPAEDRCWPHAVRSTELARTDFGATIKEPHTAKGAMHAWLAWQDPVGRPLAAAVGGERSSLQHDSPLARSFVAWFQRLFALSPARRST